MIRFENPETGPKTFAFTAVEIAGGAFGAATGGAMADFAGPDTSSIDGQIDTLTIKINAETDAITDLQDARPDADTAIAGIRTLIDGQREKVTALQHQKQEAVDAAPPPYFAYGACGAAIGMGVVALGLGVRYAYRRARGLGW